MTWSIKSLLALARFGALDSAGAWLTDRNSAVHLTPDCGFALNEMTTKVSWRVLAGLEQHPTRPGWPTISVDPNRLEGCTDCFADITAHLDVPENSEWDPVHFLDDVEKWLSSQDYQSRHRQMTVAKVTGQAMNPSAFYRPAFKAALAEIDDVLAEGTTRGLHRQMLWHLVCSDIRSLTMRHQSWGTSAPAVDLAFTKRDHDLATAFNDWTGNNPYSQPQRCPVGVDALDEMVARLLGPKSWAVTAPPSIGYGSTRLWYGLADAAEMVDTRSVLVRVPTLAAVAYLGRSSDNDITVLGPDDGYQLDEVRTAWQLKMTDSLADGIATVRAATS